MSTDTSERGLEALIVADMTGRSTIAAGGDFAEAAALPVTARLGP